MSKFMALMSAAAVAMTTGYAPPAVAQNQPGSGMAEVIVYGNDPCPRDADDQIVVCTHRPEGERYRIPQKIRPNGTRQQNESWAQRSQNLKNAGATGINSCSAVGPAGYTGCLVKQIQEAKDQRKQQAEEENPPQ
jgi:hypothetical protein